jgi:glutathione S-transferase
MALKIYGVARSRAFRNLWMAKELGLDYEHVKVDFAKGETRTPAHLALNPNGHVPVIDDDGFVLWESMAINLYLAKKYGAGTLYPTLLEDEARTWQWSFWAMTEVERPVLTALFNRAILAEDKRDAAAGDAAEKQLAKPLRVLDGRTRAQRQSARSRFHRRRPKCREHPRLGAAGSDRHVCVPGSRRVAQELRRAPGCTCRPAIAAGVEEAMQRFLAGR